MKAHVTSPPTLGELRLALTAVFVGNPLFSPTEQLQLNHAAYESDKLATLTQQLHRLRYEAARRQRVADLRRQVTAMSEPICLDAVTQFDESRRAAATACQRRVCPICYALWQLHSAGVRVHRLRWPQPVPNRKLGTHLPQYSEYQASLVDRWAAARFQPAKSLSYAHLLTSQPQ